MLTISVEQALSIALRDLQEGRLQQAEDFCHQILVQEPNHAEALHILGGIAYRVGRLDQALYFLRRAAAAAPSGAVYHGNLAEVLRVAGFFEEAIHEARESLRLSPSHAHAWCTLATVYLQVERLPESIEAAERSISLAPRMAGAYTILGTALTRVDRLAEAIEAYRRALAMEPANSTAQGNMAIALARMGRLDEAIAAYRQAVALAPGAHRIHSDLVYTLLHHPHIHPQTLFQEHLEWARRYAEPLASEIQFFDNDRNPERLLRIGYVSPNFRTQAVSYFVEPILENHDHTRHAIVCYHDAPTADAVTARMRAAADEWRDVDALSDEQLAALVRRDHIDILVDLSGHLPRHRLLAFARRPAPVQVTYLGYQATTGMTAMDYRITDSVADPEGVTDAFHTEKLVRLPLFFAYKPLRESPEPRGLPLDRTGHVTFGSMNNFVKISATVIEVWSGILRELPASRLKILIPGGDVGNDHVRAAFAERGIEASRIDLEPHRPVAHYLELFNEIDIALDSFPFTGHTTTCDALWMGVPVVTLVGRDYCGRMAGSVLTSVGLRELMTYSQAEYARTAIALASNLPQLRQLHETLRERFQASAAMDGTGFTRTLEEAYRKMWRQWCQSPRA